MGNNDSKHTSLRRIGADKINEIAKRLRVKSENDKITENHLFNALGWRTQENPITEQLWTFLSQGSTSTKFSNIIDLIDNMMYQDKESEGKCLALILQGHPKDSADLYTQHLIKLLDTIDDSANTSWKEVGISMSHQGISLLSQSLVDSIDDSIGDREMVPSKT